MSDIWNMTKEIFRAGKEDPLKEVSLKRSPTEEIENDMNKFIEKSLNDFTSPKKSSGAVTSGDPAIVTNRITEDPIVKKIPRIDTTVRKDKCDCDFYYEVRSVTASLSLVGYSSFVCNEDDEPDEKERYLKYRASGPITSCGGVTSRGTLNWEVDPFTGLICFDGGGKNIASGCFDLTSCSKTQRVYSCDGDGDGDVRESLSDRYTIEDVASNVDKMLGRVDPYGSDGVPKGKRGTVINGSNGSILTWGNQCSSKRAEYISGAGGVSKTVLFVEFSTDTEYALIDSNGKTETRTATVGQQVRIDPPDKKNSWTEIYIFNDSRYICCNTEIGNPKHEGKSYSSIFVPEEGAPPPLIPFIGPDCKAYLNVNTNSSETKSCSMSYTSQYGSGSSRFSSTRNSSSTTIASSTQFGVLSNQSEIYSANQSGSANLFVSQGDFVLIDWKRSYRSSITLTSINGASTCSGSYSGTFIDRGNSSTTTEDPCEDGEYAPNSNSCIGVDLRCETFVSERTIIVKCAGSGSEYYEPTDGSAPQSLSTTVTSTSTTTYSGLVTSQDQLQNGTWEDEDPEDNESLCAMRNESLTSKYRSDVKATYKVEFDSINDAGSIAYENWFHYYTIETDASEVGCTKYEVVAHNEKWNSISSGGSQKFSREVYLSSPANKHTICAQNVAYISRPI